MQRQGGKDEAIRRKLIAGDRAAFTALYQRHNAPMIRFATTILQSRASAEEVTQDAWLSVLRHIGGFEGRTSLIAWVYTILTNAARTRARRDGRSVSFDGPEGGDGLADAFDGRGRWRQMPALWDEITPERTIAGRDILDHVNRAIEALPAGQRAVVVLRGQEGLEAAEVCGILGLSEGNMRVLLHRGRVALRAELSRLLA